ncbi:MAG: iron chelate uptake ABC transporter family permease subunit [Acidobacteriaceae bacterium]
MAASFRKSRRVCIFYFFLQQHCRLINEAPATRCRCRIFDTHARRSASPLPARFLWQRTGSSRTIGSELVRRAHSSALCLFRYQCHSGNSALLGGTLLSVADLIARVSLRPAELPIGIVTAVVGVPVFLSLLRSREYLS